MSFTLSRSVGILFFVCALAIFAAGCGKSVSGHYADDSGTFSVDFQSGGKATVKVLGAPMDGTYTIQDKTVTVNVNGDAKVFAINDDGSLAGGGTTLKKK